MTQSNAQHPRMSLERLEAIVAAYGADERAWPQAEREEATRLAAECRSHAASAHDPDGPEEQLVARFDDAARLDELLGGAPPAPEPSLGLRARVIAAAPALRARRSWAERLDRLGQIVWPFSPLWQPMAALTAALAVGVVLGSTLPDGASATDATDISEVAFGSDVEWDPSGEWEQP